ncbi:hypothetical protein EVAR_68402_1 [Eumeta japonica]|uniref:Uncharacterized protein n=1 Tax=Eumeta variegata TaxID=151549 RepID=A0A4C2A879_EUMVA|nr:hypothetical protein EVAR_68402_1 [Eumeta japonica]
MGTESNRTTGTNSQHPGICGRCSKCTLNFQHRNSLKSAYHHRHRRQILEQERKRFFLLYSASDARNAPSFLSISDLELLSAITMRFDWVSVFELRRYQVQVYASYVHVDPCTVITAKCGKMGACQSIEIRHHRSPDHTSLLNILHIFLSMVLLNGN